MFTVKIDTGNLRSLGKRIKRAEDRGVAWTAQGYEREWVKSAPRDSGSYRSGISVKRLRDAMYSVICNVRGDDGAPYPAFVEFGTGMFAETWGGTPTGTRHMIKPRTSKFMKWTGRDGSTVFRKEIAGMKAQHPARDALESFKPSISRAFHKGFASAMQQRI